MLKVGKRGEIFTNKKLRSKAKIRAGGKVRAIIQDHKLIIEPIPSIEEILRNPVLTITTKRAEELSEEMQREEAVYG